MITLTHYLFVSSALFAISMVGLLVNRKNLIALLMCLELMLLAVNTNFLAFSRFHNTLSGDIFVFFVLAVAAAEAAIGLALIVLFYRQHQSIAMDTMEQLKG